MTAKLTNHKPTDWKNHPIVEALQRKDPFLWFNPYLEEAALLDETVFTKADLDDAEDRLERFRPFFMKAFPETIELGGLIESPLVQVEKFRDQLASACEGFPKSLWIKCDSHLPISGSIKARGGFYEVLKHAEDLAKAAGLLNDYDDYSIFASDTFKNFFSQYTIAVGSTGNLGLSIGIMSAVLGFKVKVHMSSDAKAWKKAMLRRYGAEVFEYAEDYSAAVAAGRKISDDDPMSYFVDDEHSRALFLGYTVAARRLKVQLEAAQIEVSPEKPLYVYLPCGVGGGPGGVAYGLKTLYGDSVHCFFAEPTHSPCMMLGISTQTHEGLCVQDFDLDNVTLADGLAVGRASGLVSRLMTERLDGLFTVEDQQLLKWLRLLYAAEGLKLEPSALAGTGGPLMLASDPGCKQFLIESQQRDGFVNGTHILWATGGNMVPEADFKVWLTD